MRRIFFQKVVAKAAAILAAVTVFPAHPFGEKIASTFLFFLAAMILFLNSYFDLFLIYWVSFVSSVESSFLSLSLSFVTFNCSFGIPSVGGSTRLLNLCCKAI